MVRASSAMAITQPAISYLISGLEKEVGFELFSRRGGKLTFANLSHAVPE